MAKKALLPVVSSCLVLLAILYSSCLKDKGRLQGVVTQTFCDSLNVKYSTDIQPIIQTQCIDPGCHSAGGGSSGYDISTYTFLKSFADQGRIRARVIDGATNGWMPSTGPLSLSDRQKIDCWLQDGAPNN